MRGPGRPLEATAPPPPYLIAAESSVRGAGHVPRCCRTRHTTCCVAAGQVRGLSRCFAAMYGQTEAGRGPQVGAWGASDFLGLCQLLAFAPRRGSVRHTRITSQRGFRRRGCSMAAGEAVQLGIFTGLIPLGLSRFLGTPTFSSRDVEGGLAAVASPPL